MLWLHLEWKHNKTETLKLLMRVSQVVYSIYFIYIIMINFSHT